MGANEAALDGTLTGAGASGTGMRRIGGKLVDRYRDVFAEPAPRRLLGAAALSYIGDRFNMLALVALSYNLGGGAVGVGGTLAVMMLPRFILQAGAGMLVDRFPGRGLLLGTQLGLAVVAGSFALLGAVDSLWPLYVLSFLLAAGRTIEMPAFEVRLMSVVPPERRGAANAAHGLAMTTGDLAGPLLGAGVLALLGATPLFLINAATFLVLAISVARAPRGAAQAAAETTGEGEPGEAAAPVVASGARGYLALVRQPDVLAYLGLMVTGSALLLGTITLFAERSFALGLGAGGVGVCYAAVGIGALIGGAVSGAGSYLTHRALLVVAGAAFAAAVGQVTFGGVELVVVALGALVLAGIAGEVEETAVFTYFQHRVPVGLFGRLFSLMMMGNGLGGLVGALAVPLAAREVGAGWALAGVAGLSVSCAVILVAVGMRFAAPAAPVVPA